MPFESALRALLRRAIPGLWGSITLHHVGFTRDEVAELRGLLDVLEKRLAVDLRLHPHEGEVVVMDLDCAACTAPPFLHAFTEGRAVVLVGGRTLTPRDEQREYRQDDLLRQLQALPVVQQRSALWRGGLGWAPAAGLDDMALSAGSTMPPDTDIAREHAEVLATLRRGLHDAGSPALSVSYGPGASMQLNFATRRVACDMRAKQHLRTSGELPLPSPPSAPSRSMLVCDLDRVAWDMGLAAGELPMLDAPAQWWHAPLVGCGALDVGRYTVQPSHLELARFLAHGPATPSQLRRRGRVGAHALRGFIQACLLLDLVRWQDAGEAGAADGTTSGMTGKMKDPATDAANVAAATGSPPARRQPR